MSLKQEGRRMSANPSHMNNFLSFTSPQRRADSQLIGGAATYVTHAPMTKMNWYRSLIGVGGAILIITANNSPTVLGKSISPTKPVNKITEKNIYIETIGQRIDRICLSFKLSKVALSEIFGISRQTIYDWISGKNESIKDDNLSKIDWLERLSDNLDSELKNNLWIWRHKKLPSGNTIADSLQEGKAAPDELANEIKRLFEKQKSLVEPAKVIYRKRELSDKSGGYSNYD